MARAGNDTGSRKLIGRIVAKQQHGPRLGFVGTTFEFDQEFFEIDFLPTLLELGAWDDRSWTSRIAVEKALAGLDAAAIFVDANRYRGRPQSMRIHVEPVNVGAEAKLHAKVFLCVHDQAVRLIIGSANLTENGYRKNREVAAVIDATAKDPSACRLVRAAINGFDEQLKNWRNESAECVLTRARERITAFSSGDDRDEQEWFVWSGGQVQLWSEFVKRWPAGEPVEKVSIISPFWSAEEGEGPISLFFESLSQREVLSPAGVVLCLYAEARSGPDGTWMPAFGAGLPALPKDRFRISGTAYAVNPNLAKDEVDMEDLAVKRDLHAKIVLLEGPTTSLAYLGSANFSRHGWVFLDGRGANIEAGLVIRRTGKHRQFLQDLVPATIGEPVTLTGDWSGKVVVEHIGAAEPPWPSFVRALRLTPDPDGQGRLYLCIEVDPSRIEGRWELRFLNTGDQIGPSLLQSDKSDKNAFQVILKPDMLERVLRDKDLLVSWWAYNKGREVPVNVDLAARVDLPISPGAGRPGETMLINYYQGRISFEEMFPPPDGDGGPPGNGQDESKAVSSVVDTSRIQSYQIREFVEALPGIISDLAAASMSTTTMRLALLGAVSPLSLAREIQRAVEGNNRSPVAAGFQIAEILGCLFQARKLNVPEKYSQVWNDAIKEAISKLEDILDELKAKHPSDSVPRNAVQQVRAVPA